MRGLRFQLFLLALALTLAIALLLLLIGARLDRFFKDEQAEAVALNARAVAAALSDRSHLFARSAADAQEEERRRILALFAAGDPEAVAALGEAYAPSTEAENIVSIAMRQAARVWVVDTSRTVRALTGNLSGGRSTARYGRSADDWLARASRPLVLLLSQSGVRTDSAVSRDTQLDRALDGRPTVERRLERGEVVVAAAQPIFAGDRIVAALLVEESSAALAEARATTVESILLIALCVLVTAAALSFWFASRLARRIVQLARAADGAIDAQGRVTGALAPADAVDELGQLRNSVAAMLTRLSRYNAYLEALAGRLAHELRTPLAVVRSSLDNLRLAQPAPGAAVYIDRAGAGVDRLANLIARLSEATRLEQFLAAAKPVPLDVAQLLRELGAAYVQVFASRRIVMQVTLESVVVNGVADALQQLIDKLVDNAVSFTPEGGTITLALAREANAVVICVSNDGPLLPPGLESQLFSSMVSVRNNPTREGDDRTGHLGLGLYIVRLVTEFHRGEATARNRADGTGVEFSVRLPI
jgi:signal transduction histidine kinase